LHGNGSRQRCDPATIGNPEVTRRSVVGGGLAFCLVPALARPAQATPTEMADAIRELTAGAAVKPGRVKLVLPELAENGNIVSLAVTVDSPMSEADRVKSVHIFSEMNPVTTLVRLHVSPRAGPKPTLLTNIRLADSQRVTAIAAMSDGSFWSGEASVVVTIAACIDGG
jgi:sulfur-oxidizing protein SoxY